MTPTQHITTQKSFVGENTSNMIKSLMDNAVRMERDLAKKRVAQEAREKAEAKVLELLKLPGKGSDDNRERLRKGEFDHLTVRVLPRERPSNGNPLSGRGVGVGGKGWGKGYVCVGVI
jgi:ATP-dependent protease HslVU (ClpYQ) ATPase subunit